MKRTSPSELFEILIVVQVIFIHIGIVVIVILTFWSIGTDTSDNRLLDLGPFASYVGWFVVVTSTSGCIFWVWNHLENFSTVLVRVIVANKVKSNLSFVNLGLGPVKKFVGQVIDASDIVTFFFIVTKCVSTLDLTWLPFVFSWLSWIVFWILIGISVLDFALDWSDRPDVCVTIGA